MEIFIDGYLKLPQEKNQAMSFSMGSLDGAGDGVNNVVRINGQLVWKAFIGPDRHDWDPVTILLEEFPGREFILILAFGRGASWIQSRATINHWERPQKLLSPNETEIRRNHITHDNFSQRIICIDSLLR